MYIIENFRFIQLNINKKKKNHVKIVEKQRNGIGAEETIGVAEETIGVSEDMLGGAEETIGGAVETLEYRIE